MVSFNNAGRFGNYLYEFACAWSYAKEHGLEFSVPLTENHPKWCPVYFKEMRSNEYNPNLAEVRLWENGHHYQPLEFKEEWRYCNIIVEGYRQSFKYYDKYLEELLDVFNFPYEMNKGVCSIHVRRGDYLLHPTKHPVITLGYIGDAVDYLIEIFGFGIKFKIFSDDIQWCKDNIIGIYGKNVEYSEGKNEIEDLISMANCEHQICSNSTLATWASELNRNPNKVVIVPSESNWFGEGNAHLKVYDIYRPEWIQIKY